MEETVRQWCEYKGAIHVHSSYSDGTRAIPDIARIAKSAGLDYILFADHMTLKGKERGEERYYDGLLALIGYEINDADNHNHYLAFDVDTVVPDGTDPASYVDAVRQAGGFGFIAHPDEERRAIPIYPGYPWTRWDVTGFDGIEVWNHMSEWMEQLTPLNKFFKVFSPRKSMKVPPAKTLRRWDGYAQTRPVVGIGGIDVHAIDYHLGPLTLKIFPYKVCFRSIRTHLLLPEPLPADDVGAARRAVYDCLRNGRTFFSNFRWGDAEGFRFYVRQGERFADMGSALALEDGGADFSVSVPRSADIRLLRNGETAAEEYGRELFFSTDLKGAYRVEVHRKNKGWIYSNHIRIQ